MLLLANEGGAVSKANISGLQHASRQSTENKATIIDVKPCCSRAGCDNTDAVVTAPQGGEKVRVSMLSKSGRQGSGMPFPCMVSAF